MRLRIGDLNCERIEEDVALEAPITIRVNGEHFVTLFATPSEHRQLKFMAGPVGFATILLLEMVSRFNRVQIP